MRQAETLENKFWRAAHPEPNSGCWLWRGTLAANGYAIIWRAKANGGPKDGDYIYASRFAYQLHVGQIPDGRFVCHKCDTPACVNPAHLFVGTPADNSADMVRKGRSCAGDRNPSRRPKVAAKRRGELNGHSKITAGTVLAIYRSPLSQKRAAKAFGVAQSWVWRIRRREVWRHILETEP